MFLTRRFYLFALVDILLLCGGYLFGSLFLMGQLGLAALVVLLVADAFLLYRTHGIRASRKCSDRFSNGDDNEIQLRVESSYPFPVHLSVIDEVPAIFQQRDLLFHAVLKSGESKTITYSLHPTCRGTYGFGSIRVFVASRIGLLERRFTCGEPQAVKVYPSYLLLHRYELLAMSNNLTELGVKRVRRVGHKTDFEQIKEYIQGDDYRTINWKATARRHQLMVNVYQDERSQQIYNVIDKGRVMQQAFHGMTLLDNAINASLVLSYVAMRKDDKAGLVTFGSQFETFVPASKQAGQMQILLESLYAQETTFDETDYSALCVHLAKHVSKRSLLVLYTNFSDLHSMNRQSAYLQQLSRQHCLLVVFFEDADLKAYIGKTPTETEGYYRQVIAEKFVYEKRLIVTTLKQKGIHAILTTPDKLTVDVVNKYLEMKSRQLI